MFVLFTSLGLSLSVAQWTANLEEVVAVLIFTKVAFSCLMLVSEGLGIWLLRQPPVFVERLDHSISQPDMSGDGSNDFISWRGQCWRKFKLTIWFVFNLARRLVKYHPALVGLIVFCIPGLVVDFVKAIATIECIGQFQDNQVGVAWVDFFYHIIRVVFLVLLLICCFKFHDAHFKSCHQIWYTLYLLLVTAIVVGADVLLHDILNGLSDRHPSHLSSFQTTLSNSSYINYDTRLFKFYFWSSEIFYSLNVEFVVLASEVIVHIILHIRHNSKRTSTPQPSAAALENFQSVSVQNCPAQWKYEKVVQIGLYVFIALLCIAHVTTAILTTRNIYTPYRVTRSVHHFILLVMQSIGLCLLKLFQYSKSQQPYSGFERLVLASTIGNLTWSIMNLFGEIAFLSYISDNGTVTKGSSVAGIIANILNAAWVLLQCMFMTKASRVQAPISPGPAFICFRAILLCSAMSNLTSWCINSFVLNKNIEATLVPSLYFPTASWTIIVHLTVPLQLFFRFNSFTLFLKTFFTLKYKQMSSAVGIQLANVEQNIDAP
jgi:hypothetical protein